MIHEQHSKKIGVTRKHANSLIDGLIERAKVINDDPLYLYSIDLLGIFGSFINSIKDKLGDIDIFIRLVQKPGVTLKMLHDQGFKLAPNNWPTWGIEYFPQELVLRKLKDRHTSFSFYSYDDHIDIICMDNYEVLIGEIPGDAD